MRLSYALEIGSTQCTEQTLLDWHALGSFVLLWGRRVKVGASMGAARQKCDKFSENIDSD